MRVSFQALDLLFMTIASSSLLTLMSLNLLAFALFAARHSTSVNQSTKLTDGQYSNPVCQRK